MTGGSVNADIVRCTDEKGSVSFTNTHCSVGSHEAQPLQTTADPPTLKVLAATEKFAVAEQAHAEKARDTIASVKGYSLDERTVRGAKAETDVMDVKSNFARQQASAEKALRVNPWAFSRLCVVVYYHSHII